MPDAYEDGLRLLSRRSLSRREVEDRLSARGHARSDVDDAVDRLIAIAAIDDAALARGWIASVAAPAGRGRARAIATLSARGVDEAVAAAAWSLARDDGAIDEDRALARAVRKKLGASVARAEKGRLARVYNALLSEGFDPQRVAAALAPYGLEGNEG